MRYKLQCNFCGETFIHTGSSYPDSCPHCGAYVGLDGKPEVTLPFVSSKADKSPDDLHRAMEQGAKHRAQMAAEITGQPLSDFSGMLHTDMRDNLREGDTSFVPTRMKDGMTAQFGNNGAAGVDPSVLAGVKSGPAPNAGAAEITNINTLHRTHGRRIVAAGTQGKY